MFIYFYLGRPNRTLYSALSSIRTPDRDSGSASIRTGDAAAGGVAPRKTCWWPSSARPAAIARGGGWSGALRHVHGQ